MLFYVVYFLSPRCRFAGSGSLGSRQDLLPVLEVEPTVGELSSMPKPEGICGGGVSLESSPMRSKKQGGPLHSSSRPVLASPIR